MALGIEPPDRFARRSTDKLRIAGALVRVVSRLGFRSPPMTVPASTSSTRPRVVILGAGFGGLYAAKSLNKASVNVTVVDRRNHHLFQPLLYQVAAPALAPGELAKPIRSILRRQRNAEVFLAEA